MKATTILLLLSLSILNAEDTPSPYTRSDTIDSRDKAIEKRAKLEASIVDKAENIYSARLSDNAEAKQDIKDVNKTSIPEKKVEIKKEDTATENSNLVTIEEVLNGTK